MLCLKATLVVLVLAFLAQHFLQAEGRKEQQDRKGRGRTKQDFPSPKPASPSNQGTGKKSKGSSGHVASKGRFSTKDQTQCTWTASGDHELILSISCINQNQESFHCEYTANPKLCPQYETSSGTFWKQISRSLKKQKKLCQDPKALVKAGMCKTAPKEAHFKLKTSTKTQSPPKPSNEDCKGLSNRQKLAKEYCSSSWSAVCTFFFAMVENEEC